MKSSAQANPGYDIHNPPAFRPWATLVLIAINGTVFVVDVVTGASSSGVPGLSGGSGPVVSGQLTQLGGLSATHVAAGQIYRLVTAGFLHAGFVHLALNMLALYFLTRVWSQWPYAGMFLALAVIACLRSIWHLIRSRMLKP